MDGLDYMWRLDDDSKIYEPIKHDLFKFMADRQLQFGYLTEREDTCVCHLWDKVREYIKITGIKPEFFNELSETSNYYNNFEVSSMQLWRSDEYQHYINYLDKLAGVYYYRWGDAPIKTIAVSLFVPKDKTHVLTGIKYQHQGFKNF